MMSILFQCAMLCCMTSSTVLRTRTSHSRPRQRSCQPCICCMLFSFVRPTAVTLSPWLRAAFTSERPMWPVAPNTIHVFCLGGFVGLGGSVVDGSESLGLLSNKRREEGLGMDMMAPTQRGTTWRDLSRDSYATVLDPHPAHHDGRLRCFRFSLPKIDVHDPCSGSRVESKVHGRSGEESPPSPSSSKHEHHNTIATAERTHSTHAACLFRSLPMIRTHAHSHTRMVDHAGSSILPQQTALQVF